MSTALIDQLKAYANQIEDKLGKYVSNKNLTSYDKDPLVPGDDVFVFKFTTNTRGSTKAEYNEKLLLEALNKYVDEDDETTIEAFSTQGPTNNYTIVASYDADGSWDIDFYSKHLSSTELASELAL